MEPYLKARVQLIDENGDKHDCEIISDSKEIFYTNQRPMPSSVGNIPVGTSFDKASLADILDDILYDKISPIINNITFSNGDVTELNEDIAITKPKGYHIDDFTLSSVVQFGSHDEITVNLYVITGENKKVQSQTISRNSVKITEQVVSFEVEGFEGETSIVLEAVAGTDRQISAKIYYQFISPIWVGWIRPDIINSIGEMDKSVAEDYFQEWIDHEFSTLEKRWTVKSNQGAFIVPNIGYINRQWLAPCILIPESWGELKRITDTNGNNIINSYATKQGLDICYQGVNIEHYIAYVSRQIFAIDNELIRGVTYVTDTSDQDINLDNFKGNGIPMISGYSMQYNIPLDERFYVKTYGDLLGIKYTYPGLMTYVEDINTTFRFEKGHWTPVCTKLHVVENYDELTAELGGWDDLAINAYDGKIWKKRYNNQWERYGDIKAEDIAINISLIKEENNDA